ncbi:MAG: Ribosomal protein L11 methyltransferase [Fimbriimonadales bacterium]|nr:MAG: 50S ribosomal protein L11 methyltransferase [Armatimonadota bacterium]MBV6502754.1 Ribosomal protein L11 methyltransferase [Fimbriimonadales bacterium]MCE7900121.1 50S ribosomal protein L11 methyltransferase [Armatimonadetes bacterium ATM1]MDL1929422.1 50S ribosomal protein L11 methyltransferase [Fimbriimonadia bacterium ATM]MBC6968992.1 50S ribosomal protein L11 methyltransferase [Armatimonadota bacterium]
MSDWICVTARFRELPPDWSPVHEVFAEHGCPATVEQDAPPQMSAYVYHSADSDVLIRCLERELRAYGAHEVTTEKVPEENWEESWKQFFHIRRVGRRILICPTWEVDRLTATEEDVVILLDPGQAFGTGDHPTTRMCLSLLEDVMTPGVSVLDIGSGSGILSIAAKKLGAARVLALDTDQAAVDASVANAARNECEVECRRAEDTLSVSEPFDVVVSNIISAVLMRIAHDVHSVLRPGGLWIVSGIIRDNWQDVQVAAEACGFRTSKTVEEDGWVSCLFSR